MGPDRCHHLQAFPSTCSVAEISDFLFARLDLGLFAGMYRCLWGAVSQSWPDQQTKDAILAKMEEDNFTHLVQSLWHRDITPLSLIRAALRQGHHRCPCHIAGGCVPSDNDNYLGSKSCHLQVYWDGLTCSLRQASVSHRSILTSEKLSSDDCMYMLPA